ncbi:hypothetical protein RA28_00455 [Ruegeria sp. ANG-S4]|nr:hypothetical protein RA28_00455 [Ruegeria sp. ANG-S4]
MHDDIEMLHALLQFEIDRMPTFAKQFSIVAALADKLGRVIFGHCDVTDFARARSSNLFNAALQF